MITASPYRPNRKCALARKAHETIMKGCAQENLKVMKLAFEVLRSLEQVEVQSEKLSKELSHLDKNHRSACVTISVHLR